MGPNLDAWLAQPTVRICHRRSVPASADEVWSAANALQLGETRRLGRLIRLRIPGLSNELTFHDMFRAPPFNVLHEDERTLVSGLVGRIWTLRRDYPRLADPEEFRRWSARGTVRVLFAMWVEPDGAGAALVSETRVAAVDRLGRIGLGAVRPVINGSNRLILTDGLTAATKDFVAGCDPPSVPRRNRRV